MIGSGFAIILMLMLVVGLTSYWGLTQVMNVQELYQETNRLTENFITAQVEVSDYLLNNFDEGRSLQAAARERASRWLKQSRELIRKIQEHQLLVDAGRKEPDILLKKMKSYEGAFDEYCNIETRKMDMEKIIVKQALALRAYIDAGEIWLDQMQNGVGKMEVVLGGYMNRNSGNRWKQVNIGFSEFQAAYDEWFAKINNSDKLRAKAELIESTFVKYRGSILKHHEEVVNQANVYKQMLDDNAMIMKAKEALAGFAVEKMKAVKKISLTVMWGLLLASLLIGIVYALVNTRRVVGRLTRIILGIRTGAEQVAAGSGQVSSTSQSLAEASSEQAASLEEASSVLEEMSAMIRQNAENAGQADSLARGANKVADRANKNIRQLTISMDEISTASHDTSKIVKTIDEIAFQTNLLALNAAVEAARAGEAGAGFAVVAGEVRNLAIRSAEAAKNTEELIDSTIKKVEQGAILVKSTNDAFSEVVDSAAKVGVLVSEIAVASQEQSQGIEQVNTTVSEIDKVTQQNAASAEESASASEEMSAQAEQMKDYVSELADLVGARGVESGRQFGGDGGKASQKAVFRGRQTAGKQLVEKKTETRSPKQILPLDEADF